MYLPLRVRNGYAREVIHNRKERSTKDLKSINLLALGIFFGIASAAITADLDDDGDVDLRDYAEMQNQFTGAADYELASVHVDSNGASVVPGNNRFVVRSVVVGGVSIATVCLDQDGEPVLCHDSEGSNFVPHLVFPPNGSLILTSGSQLTVSSWSMTLMGYME